MNKKMLSLAAIGGMLTLPSYAAIDIATQITSFTGTAEDYVEAALPAVFTIVALYFLIKVIKRFTK